MTAKRGRPKGTSNVITSSPFRKRLLQSKINKTASRPVFGDKDSNKRSGKLVDTKPHFKKREDDDDVKCIFCDGKFSEDTSGEEWTQCLTCNTGAMKSVLRLEISSVCLRRLLAVSIRPNHITVMKIQQY